MTKRGKSLPAAERRALSVQTVLQLAAGQNPSDITTEAVAAKMGLTQAALFRHFPTKNMLWQAVMQWTTSELLMAVQQAASAASSPFDALERIYKTHVAFVAEYPGVPRVLFAELQNPEGSEARKIVSDMLARYVSLLKDIIAEGEKRGQIDSCVDVRSAATMFIGTLQGQVIQAMIAGDGAMLPEHAARQFKLLRRALERQKSPFETYAVDYDNWFETAAGAELFRLELNCLKKTVETKNSSWLEVGVGSGRFAVALGIGTGADPAPSMVKIASSRGIETVTAPAEALPFYDASFDGVLMVCSICFLQDPTIALSECHRVLQKEGRLVIGFIPADSRWGQYHAGRGREGHRFYAGAQFYTSKELRHLAERAGFAFDAGYDCILPPPDAQQGNESIRQEAGMDNGFKVLSFYKGTSIYCREKPGDKADGAEKPECTRRT